MLLIAGYIFYGWWDVRFLFLIAFSTAIDFSIRDPMEKSLIHVAPLPFPGGGDIPTLLIMIQHPDIIV